ncbi:MAG: OmpA family protein [Spirochaetales bacterium]|nr:OmpA family protein [Spirochaetales bacterium]
MKHLSIGLIFFGFVGFFLTGQAQLFEYRYQPGERYRIVSQVQQEVYEDDFLLSQSNQLNRIQIFVESVEPLDPTLAAPRPWAVPNGPTRAFHRLTYQNSVEAQTTTAVHQFDREYTADFWRDTQGFFDISQEYFVPTVQNVPVFPPYPLEIGQTWSAPGVEVHDLRGGFFNLSQPFRFPMPVTYRYLGREWWEGKEYDLLEIEYQIYHPTGLPRFPATNPRLITGFSSQRMYWDSLKGRPAYYEEVYELVLVLSEGTLFTFRGTANARTVDSQPLNRSETVRALEDEIEQRQIEDVGVRVTDEGISLILEDIRFQPDSAELLPQELQKLDQIARILEAYPYRDILVTGHTALAGTVQGRQLLSEERAKSVGQFLLDSGVRDRDQVMFRGLGANEPLGSNATEEGRRLNRRVEIIILDN